MPMPIFIDKPTRITAAGNKPKLIDEFVGHVNNRESRLSVAMMQSPAGWEEPAQTPEFDEYTLVLEGSMTIEHASGSMTIRPGQAVLCKSGERIRYTTPEGAKYVAICLPAFSPDTVHRDTD